MPSTPVPSALPANHDAQRDRFAFVVWSVGRNASDAHAIKSPQCVRPGVLGSAVLSALRSWWGLAVCAGMHVAGVARSEDAPSSDIGGLCIEVGCCGSRRCSGAQRGWRCAGFHDVLSRWRAHWCFVGFTSSAGTNLCRGQPCSTSAWLRRPADELLNPTQPFRLPILPCGMAPAVATRHRYRCARATVVLLPAEGTLGELVWTVMGTDMVPNLRA